MPPLIVSTVWSQRKVSPLSDSSSSRHHLAEREQWHMNLEHTQPRAELVAVSFVLSALTCLLGMIDRISWV